MRKKVIKDKKGKLIKEIIYPDNNKKIEIEEVIVNEDRLESRPIKPSKKLTKKDKSVIEEMSNYMSRRIVKTPEEQTKFRDIDVLMDGSNTDKINRLVTMFGKLNKYVDRIFHEEINKDVSESFAMKHNNTQLIDEYFAELGEEEVKLPFWKRFLNFIVGK